MSKNPHVEKAVEQYASVGKNFYPIFEWYLERGRVLCMPEILCLVRECDSRLPENVEPERCDALYIEYLSYDDSAIHHLWDIRERIQPRYETVCYYRGFKNKATLTMPYDRLRNLLNRSIEYGKRT